MLPFIRIIELKTTKNVIQTMFLSMYSCPWEHKVLWSRSVDPNYWTNPELNFEFIKYSPIYISWELFQFQVYFNKCKKIIMNNKNRSRVCIWVKILDYPECYHFSKITHFLGSVHDKSPWNHHMINICLVMFGHWKFITCISIISPVICDLYSRIFIFILFKYFVEIHFSKIEKKFTTERPI